MFKRLYIFVVFFFLLFTAALAQNQLSYGVVWFDGNTDGRVDTMKIEFSDSVKISAESSSQLFDAFKLSGTARFTSLLNSIDTLTKSVTLLITDSKWGTGSEYFPKITFDSLADVKITPIASSVAGMRNGTTPTLVKDKATPYRLGSINSSNKNSRFIQYTLTEVPIYAIGVFATEGKPLRMKIIKGTTIGGVLIPPKAIIEEGSIKPRRAGLYNFSVDVQDSVGNLLKTSSLIRIIGLKTASNLPKLICKENQLLDIEIGENGQYDGFFDAPRSGEDRHIYLEMKGNDAFSFFDTTSRSFGGGVSMYDVSKSQLEDITITNVSVTSSGLLDITYRYKKTKGEDRHTGEDIIRISNVGILYDSDKKTIISSNFLQIVLKKDNTGDQISNTPGFNPLRPDYIPLFVFSDEEETIVSSTIYDIGSLDRLLRTGGGDIRIPIFFDKKKGYNPFAVQGTYDIPINEKNSSTGNVNLGDDGALSYGGLSGSSYYPNPYSEKKIPTEVVNMAFYDVSELNDLVFRANTISSNLGKIVEIRWRLLDEQLSAYKRYNVYSKINTQSKDGLLLSARDIDTASMKTPRRFLSTKGDPLGNIPQSFVIEYSFKTSSNSCFSPYLQLRIVTYSLQNLYPNFSDESNKLIYERKSGTGKLLQPFRELVHQVNPMGKFIDTLTFLKGTKTGGSSDFGGVNYQNVDFKIVNSHGNERFDYKKEISSHEVKISDRTGNKFDLKRNIDMLILNRSRGLGRFIAPDQPIYFEIYFRDYMKSIIRGYFPSTKGALGMIRPSKKRSPGIIRLEDQPFVYSAKDLKDTIKFTLNKYLDIAYSLGSNQAKIESKIITVGSPTTNSQEITIPMLAKEGIKLTNSASGSFPARSLDIDLSGGGGFIFAYKTTFFRNSDAPKVPLFEGLPKEITLYDTVYVVGDPSMNIRFKKDNIRRKEVAVRDTLYMPVNARSVQLVRDVISIPGYYRNVIYQSNADREYFHLRIEDYARDIFAGYQLFAKKTSGTWERLRDYRGVSYRFNPRNPLNPSSLFISKNVPTNRLYMLTYKQEYIGGKKVDIIDSMYVKILPLSNTPKLSKDFRIRANWKKDRLDKSVESGGSDYGIVDALTTELYFSEIGIREDTLWAEDESGSGSFLDKSFLAGEDNKQSSFYWLNEQRDTISEEGYINLFGATAKGRTTRLDIVNSDGAFKVGTHVLYLGRKANRPEKKLSEYTGESLLKKIILRVVERPSKILNPKLGGRYASTIADQEKIFVDSVKDGLQVGQIARVDVCTEDVSVEIPADSWIKFMEKLPPTTSIYQVTQQQGSEKSDTTKLTVDSLAIPGRLGGGVERLTISYYKYTTLTDIDTSITGYRGTPSPFLRYIFTVNTQGSFETQDFITNEGLDRIPLDTVYICKGTPRGTIVFRVSDESVMGLNGKRALPNAYRFYKDAAGTREIGTQKSPGSFLEIDFFSKYLFVNTPADYTTYSSFIHGEDLISGLKGCQTTPKPLLFRVVDTDFADPPEIGFNNTENSDKAGAIRLDTNQSKLRSDTVFYLICTNRLSGRIFFHRKNSSNFKDMSYAWYDGQNRLLPSNEDTVTLRQMGIENANTGRYIFTLRQRQGYYSRLYKRTSSGKRDLSRVRVESCDLKPRVVVVDVLDSRKLELLTSVGVIVPSEQTFCYNDGIKIITPSWVTFVNGKRQSLQQARQEDISYSITSKLQGGDLVKSTNFTKQQISLSLESLHESVGGLKVGGENSNHTIDITVLDNLSGCVQQASVKITIAPKQAIRLAAGSTRSLTDTAFCANSGILEVSAVRLVGGSTILLSSALAQGIFYLNNVRKPSSQNVLSLDLAEIHGKSLYDTTQKDTIRFEWTDRPGCTYSIEKYIYTHPVPEIQQGKIQEIEICQGTQLRLGLELAKGLNEKNYSFEWTIDGSEDKSQTSKNYTGATITDESKFDVKVKIKNRVTGCEIMLQEVINVGAKPKASFERYGLTETRGTVFYISQDNPKLLAQDVQELKLLIDGNTTRRTAPINFPVQINHTFGSAGTYDVELTIVSKKGCVDVSKRKVHIFNHFTSYGKNKFYFENFENGLGDWHIGKTSLNGKNDRLKSTWRRTDTIPGDQSRVSSLGSWAVLTGTTKPTETSSTLVENPYNESEFSYVYSPSFDLTKFGNPAVSFQRLVDFESIRDGVVFQYSVDDGRTWKNIGDYDSRSIFTESGTLGWYQNEGISADPGGQSPGLRSTGLNPDQKGWSSKDSEGRIWKTAFSKLDNIPQNERSWVRFRFAFASQAGTKSSVGFGVDNIRIYELNKVVLVEKYSSVLSTLSKQLDDLSRFDKEKDRIILNYFSDLSNTKTEKDPINSENKKDPATRVAYYGIKDIPTLVISGFNLIEVENGNVKNSVDRSVISIQNSSLLPAKFLISNFNARVSSGSNIVTSNVEFRPLENFGSGEELALYIVIVEERVRLNADVGVYRKNDVVLNVVRKVLPSPDGKFVRGPIATNQVLELKNQKWEVSNFQTTDSITVVAFIQDIKTKEVYQSAYLRISGVGTILGVEDEFKDVLKVYPNPTNKTLNVSFGNEGIKSDIQWSLIDQRGAVLLKGEQKRGVKFFKINVSIFSEGLYFFTISSSNASKKIFKILIKDK